MNNRTWRLNRFIIYLNYLTFYYTSQMPIGIGVKKKNVSKNDHLVIKQTIRTQKNHF